MKLCFIDTETTGTDHHKHGIIQLAGIVVIDGEEKETFNYKIQPFPSDAIEDAALAVNGVKREDLTAYQDPEHAYRDFTAMLGKYVDKYNKADKFWFVGYNARFDADFVRQFFEKCGDVYFGSWFWFPPIDVMNQAAVSLLDERDKMLNFKLGTVACKLKITADGELHDALNDIRLTQNIFNYLRG